MIPLDRLQEIARQRTKEAMEGWEVPDHLRPDLTLGTFFEDDAVVFALYIAGERPEDAIHLSEVRLTRSTGEGEVEIYREHLRRIG